MMMKLMKFLVVALVAGGVCAPVPSQAGEGDGKAVMCKFENDPAEKTYTVGAQLVGRPLTGVHFASNLAAKITIAAWLRPRAIQRIGEFKYWATNTHIWWENSSGHKRFSLDRKTLQLELKDVFEVKQHAQYELIEAEKIDAYFQPYLDYGNALDEKEREGNKI